MKVLFVHYGDDWIAGSEIALLEIMRALKKKGVAPFLWCNAPAMEKAAREADIPVRRDDFTFYFDYSSPPFSLSGYRRLVGKARALLTETGAELVHCNSAAPAQWMSAACWRARVPWLINMHSPYLKRSRYVLCMHLADEIVAVAKAIATPLLADGMAPDRVKIVYNGFDEASLLKGEAKRLRAELGIPEGAVVAAIAGSLIPRKGHDILFAAMRLLEQPLPHLLVIGDGPDANAIKLGASGLPVHFLGRRDDLGAILRDAADFLVAPSRQEAFGRVIIEAALAGIPAIGADVGGIPEAILDGKTGLIVPPQSPSALAAALARLSGDDHLRKTLGAAAQTRARRDFAIDHCAGQLLAEFEALRKKPRQTAAGRFRPYINLLLRRSDSVPA